jgi:hypothetical protein
MTEPEWPNFSAGLDDGLEPALETPAAAEPTGIPPVADVPVVPTTAAAAAAEMLPKYRFDEINTRYERSEQRVSQLMQIIADLRAAKPVAGPAAPQEPETIDEDAQRIRAQLLRVYPELKMLEEFKRLVPHLPQLETVAQQAPEQARERAAYYTQLADTTLGAATKAVFEAMGMKDVKPDSPWNQIVRERFSAWVSADEGRSSRYSAQDRDLVTEFSTWFQTAVVDPARAQARVQQRREAVARLPVGGKSSDPASASPPKPSSDDEDAVFKHAWTVAQNIRSASP